MASKKGGSYIMDAVARASRPADGRSRPASPLPEFQEGLQARLLQGLSAAYLYDFPLAIGCLKDVLNQQPDNWLALDGLCVILRKFGEVHEAIRFGLRACQLNPRSPEGMSNLGECFIETTQFSEALLCFEQVVAAKPSSSRAHCFLGLCLDRLGRNEAALAAYIRASELDEKDIQAWVSIAAFHEKRSGTEASEPYLAKAGEATGSQPSKLLELAHELISAGLTKRAEPILAKLVRLELVSLADLTRLAWMLQQLGLFEDARAILAKAIQRNPDYANAYANLVAIQQIHAADEPLLNVMEDQLSTASITAKDRRSLHFALGKARDDLGEYERAYSHFRAANQVSEPGRRSFSAETFKAKVDQIIDVFTADFFAENRSVGLESRVPVLIVGMVRSGTSLAEQILSSHAQVGACGELPYLLENGNVFDASGKVEKQQAKSVAHRYLALLNSLAPGCARVTDKMPNNFLMLGVFHLLFPRARIIHCRRNPADTCLSAYVTAIHNSLDFAQNPDDIVDCYEQYLRLMEHWRKVLPADCLTDLDYEHLVFDGEAQIRRMLKFCGLSWDENCLTYHQRNGTVNTPSLWQVRQPLYRSSIGRWQNYAHWLPEFARFSVH